MKPRKEAIESGKRTYSTGKPCVRGHISERRTFNSRCVACETENSRERSDKTLGVRIATLREQMSYTREAFAAETKLTVSYIWRIETNKQDPTIRVLVRIANALDVSMDYLTCRTDRMDLNYD